MNTAEITGLVRDQSGQVIPKATVIATNSATHLEFRAVANYRGEYLLAQVPVGLYSLTAGTPGFRQAVSANLTVHVGERIRMDFELAVGEQSEVIVVRDEPALLQTESAEIKDVVLNQQVLERCVTPSSVRCCTR